MSGENTESYRERLSPLQSDFLSRFFAHSPDFFLTGGAALIGFYGLTRTTNDLDLFTLDENAFVHCDSPLRAAAQEVGGEMTTLRTYPHFRRYHIQRGEEAVEIDVVCEFAPQILPEKERCQGVRVDPILEIAVNKVCALVGRSEVRDIWDLARLLDTGLQLDELIEKANLKDGGVDTESVVFVLSGLDWSALTAAAKRVGLDGFQDIAERFQGEAKRLALEILPPERRP